MVTKYKETPKTIAIILGAIGEVLIRSEASILAHISQETLSLWKRQEDFS